MPLAVTYLRTQLYPAVYLPIHVYCSAGDRPKAVKLVLAFAQPLVQLDDQQKESFYKGNR